MIQHQYQYNIVSCGLSATFGLQKHDVFEVSVCPPIQLNSRSAASLAGKATRQCMTTLTDSITSWKNTCNDRRTLHSNEVKVLINWKEFTLLQVKNTLR